MTYDTIFLFGREYPNSPKPLREPKSVIRRLELIHASLQGALRLYTESQRPLYIATLTVFAEIDLELSIAKAAVSLALENDDVQPSLFEL